MIFEAMGVGKAEVSIGFLVLLCVLVLGSSEARRKTAEVFPVRVHGVPSEIDEETVRCFVV